MAAKRKKATSKPASIHQYAGRRDIEQLFSLKIEDDGRLEDGDELTSSGEPISVYRWSVVFDGSLLCSYRRKSDAIAHIRKIREAILWDASKP